METTSQNSKIKLLTKLVDGREMPFPSPTKYDLKYIDVDSSKSGRNDAGYMNRDVIRTNIATIDAAWENLTSSQVKEMEAILNGSNSEINLKYFSENGFKNGTFYIGDRNKSLNFIFDNEVVWTYSFSFIEI